MVRRDAPAIEHKELGVRPPARRAVDAPRLLGRPAVGRVPAKQGKWSHMSSCGGGAAPRRLRAMSMTVSMLVFVFVFVSMAMTMAVLVRVSVSMVMIV